MAKKSSSASGAKIRVGASFIVEFDGAFSVTVEPAAAAAAMRKVIKSPNVAVRLGIPAPDGSMYMCSLYPADERIGLVTFEWIAERLTVSLKGSWQFVNQEIIAEPWFAAAAEEGIPVEAGISDANSMPLAVGPDGASTVVVGILRPSDAAAKSALRPTKSVTNVSIMDRIKEHGFKGHVADALEMVYCADADLAALLKRFSGNGAREIDLEVETRLEALGTEIADGKSQILEAAERLGCSEASLSEQFAARWLEGEVVGCGFETKVRASEVLAAWSVRANEPRTVVLKRLKSKRWEHRMWAARIVRLAGWEDAEKVLAPLKKDPFEDDNGIYLVREAAGFDG
jgi:hypothetical protein